MDEPLDLDELEATCRAGMNLHYRESLQLIERVRAAEAELARTEALRGRVDELAEYSRRAQVAEEALADLRARLEAAEKDRDNYRDKYAELNGALCWDTTCLNCPSLLDSSYAEYVRAEKAEAELTALRDGIRALADRIAGDSGWEHDGGCEGEGSDPNCFACIEGELRVLASQPLKEGGE